MIDLDSYLYSSLLLIHWVSHYRILDLTLFCLTVNEVGLGDSCGLCRFEYVSHLIFK